VQVEVFVEVFRHIILGCVTCSSCLHYIKFKAEHYESTLSCAETATSPMCVICSMSRPGYTGARVWSTTWSSCDVELAGAKKTYSTFVR
jgi:hypothetical protein